MKHKKIVFVCTGNTCRSPMAEIVLRELIKEKRIKWWNVQSRGIYADVGGRISTNSLQVLTENNLNIGNFTPKQLTQKVIEDATIVVCMTSEQMRLLEGCGNVTCIKEVCGFDIPDPFGGDLALYRFTYDKIHEACEIIINKIILDNIGEK